jgi:hypothetical protein
MRLPGRARAAALAVALLFFAPQHARADEHIVPEADFRRFSDWAWFALGAAAGFVGHELGHVAADVMAGKSIDFVETKLGPLPFFAIQPCCNLTRAEQYAVASAGFLVQDVASELIFWIAPRVRSQRHAFLKGVLVLHMGLSLGYAVTALAGIGPPQSDVNTMARGLDVPPWQVGLMLAVPAVVDLYRYLVPGSVWAPWVSVQAKLLTLGLVFTF